MSRQRSMILGILWAIAAALGLAAMLDFELTPAERSQGVPSWPTQSSMSLDQSLPTAVMFLHPHCPCSQASLAELKVLASACQGMVTLHVLLVKPPGVEAGWEQTSLAKDAMNIPGIKIRCDVDGREAALFGATTSGEMMLFAPDGRRTFDGGITVSRGHQGDNAGLAALENIIRSGTDHVDATPVYGCSLLSPCGDAKAP